MLLLQSLVPAPQKTSRRDCKEHACRDIHAAHATQNLAGISIVSQPNKRTSVRRALSVTLGQRGITLIFSFGSTIILSRLLTPAEVGVYSVAAGLLALVQMLRDFGVSEYLVQKQTLDRGVIGTVFTMNLAIAWCLGATVLLTSGPIGAFYGNPGLTRVLAVMSLVFFLLPFGTTTQALLSRNMEFGKLARIHLAGSVTRSCVKVGLAFMGFSYMSLAWGSVAGILITIAGFSIWGWQYRVRALSLTYWRQVLHFGSSRTVADVASQLGGQSANIVIGKMLGMTDAGLYSRGYGFVSMFRTNILGAIGTVAFPAFAREHRENATAPELYRKALVYITGISWPFFACGAILAYPIITILFGRQWEAAVPLMRWLCVAALIGTLMYQANRFLVALGRVHTVTKVELQYQIARVVITIAAAFHSAEAVAAAQVLVMALATALYYRQMRCYPVLTFGNCAKALVPSGVVTITTSVVPAIVVLWPGFVHQYTVGAFALAFIGGGIGWMLGLALSHHPLLEELRQVAPWLRRSHLRSQS